MANSTLKAKYKPVRLHRRIHRRLTILAKEHGRKLGAEVEWLLDQVSEVSVPRKDAADGSDS